MDTDKNANEEQKDRAANPGSPFGNFQTMREMMKQCCGNDATPPDCRSMMARMMKSDKPGEPSGKQASKGDRHE